jgi:hypothetical protein
MPIAVLRKAEHMNLEEIDQGLTELIVFVLDFGIKCVRDLGGPFIPCVTVEDGAGKRHLHSFVADRLEQAIDEAMVFADSVDAQSRVAVSYDGFVAIDGTVLWFSVSAWTELKSPNECHHSCGKGPREN